MWQFEVGKDVVCVDDNWSCQFGTTLTPRPVKGETYRVESIDTCENIVARSFTSIICPGDVRLFLRFVGRQDWWLAERFRPVRKTDIGELEKLLVPITTKRKVHEPI